MEPDARTPATSAVRYTFDPQVALMFRDLGLSLGNVLRRAGLPANLLSAGPAALTPEQAVALWEAVIAEADDPTLPIRIGQAISMETFSPAVFAAICSPNFNVAAARIARHRALLGPLRVIVTPTEAGTELDLRWPADHVFPATVITTEIVWWVALIRMATRTRIVPVEVTSTQPPDAPDALADYLGIAVVLGYRNTITISDQDAARPFLTANEEMWDFFEPSLRQRLAELETTASTSEQVRAALLELLPTGRATIDHVARDLAVSTRTLQRQLKGEGTSFQSVLAETRESLARHYLTEGRLGTHQIALLLGYDEPKSFFRAFHSWTGTTPEQARRTST
jgi:AraC-like DNA-binding protein